MYHIFACIQINGTLVKTNFQGSFNKTHFIIKSLIFNNLSLTILMIFKEPILSLLLIFSLLSMHIQISSKQHK